MDDCKKYITRVINDKHDSEAWGYLYVYYKNYLLKIISRYIYDNHYKENMLQETWIRVIKMIDRYNPEYKFNVWLMLNTVNICKNWLRANKKRQNDLNIIDDEENQEQYFESSKQENFDEDVCNTDVIKKALDSVGNPKYVLAFKLKFVNQMSLKSISKILGEKENTVKNWIYRTREKVSLYIKEHTLE